MKSLSFRMLLNTIQRPMNDTMLKTTLEAAFCQTCLKHLSIFIRKMHFARSWIWDIESEESKCMRLQSKLQQSQRENNGFESFSRLFYRVHDSYTKIFFSSQTGNLFPLCLMEYQFWFEERIHLHFLMLEAKQQKILNIDSCNLLYRSLKHYWMLSFNIFSSGERFSPYVEQYKSVAQKMLSAWESYCSDYCCWWWCGWKKDSLLRVMGEWRELSKRVKSEGSQRFRGTLPIRLTIWVLNHIFFIEFGFAMTEKSPKDWYWF